MSIGTRIYGGDENGLLADTDVDRNWLDSFSPRRRRKKIKRSRKVHIRKSRRRRVTRKVRYTKRGQPYVILPSGRAKFIKKRK